MELISLQVKPSLPVVTLLPISAFPMTNEVHVPNTGLSYTNYVVDMLSDQYITVYHSEHFDELVQLS